MRNRPVLNRTLWCILCFGVLLVVSLPADEPASDDGSTVLRGHLGPVLMGNFTPDGQRALTVSSDETVRLWDLSTQKELRNYPGHTGPLFCLALSQDGRTLTTGAYDNTVRVWDVPLVKPIVRVPAHTGDAGGLALSADARWLVTGAADKNTLVWNLSAFANLAARAENRSPETAKAAVRKGDAEALVVAIRNDGQLFATGDAHGRIRLHSPFVETSQGDLGTHSGGVTGLAFHSNNQQLISTGKDGVVRVWQLPPSLPRQLLSLAGAIQDFLLVPNPAMAVVATDDKKVRLYDGTTGQTIREFPPSEGTVTRIALTSNHALLAVAEDNGKIRFWNLADASPRGQLTAHDKAVRDMVFHPDSQTLSTSGAEGSVKSWQIPEPAATEQPGPLRIWPNIQVASLAISPDGSKLFAGTNDGKILQWKASDGTLERTLEGHKGAIAVLKVLPNGQQLVSGGVDKSVKQWSLADGALLRTGVYSAAIRDAAITSDGGRLLITQTDGHIHLMDIASGVDLQTFSGTKAATWAGWLNDNQTIVSASNDKHLHVWKQSATRSFAPHEKPILDLALYNGGAQVITAGGDGKVVMSDVNNGQVVRAFEGLIGEAKAVASRLDNQRVAAGNAEGKVLLWNAGNAQLLQTLSVPGEVRSLAFSPDHQKLAVATTDKKLTIFGPPLPPQSSQPGNELVLHQQSETESVLTRIQFDRDNRSVWATDETGHINQWTYASPVQIRQFNHGGPVYGVAISRDGKTIVSCSTDQTVRIWDVTTGQQKAAMSGHQGAVHAVAFSPDESLIVSSGADRTIRLWDAAGGRQLKQLANFDETMYVVAIHPEGKTVAVGGADRKVHLINLLTGAIERTLEGHTDFIHSVKFNPKGNRVLSYGYAGEFRIWETTTGKVLLEEQIGRIGNDADYAPDGTRVLLSNGDGTARVFELPAPAR